MTCFVLFISPWSYSDVTTVLQLMEMTFASILIPQEPTTNAKIINAWQQYSLMGNFRHFQKKEFVGRV